MRQTALTVFVALQVIITIVVLGVMGYTNYFCNNDALIEVVPLDTNLGSLPSNWGLITVLNSVNRTNDNQTIDKGTVSTTAMSTVHSAPTVIHELNSTSPQSSVRRPPAPVVGSAAVLHGNSSLLPFIKETQGADPPRVVNNSKVFVTAVANTTDNQVPIKEMVSTTPMSTTKEKVYSDAVTNILDEHTSNLTTLRPNGTPTHVDLNNQSHGYTLLYSVFEESTNGAKNIWQFQILAKQLGTHVVEPFAIDSTFRMNALAPHFNRSLRFGDYFDVEKWNELVTRHGGSPLVKWEEFLLNAPREAIVLYTRKSNSLTEPLIIAYDDDVQSKCNIGKGMIPATDLNWLKTAGFNISKVMCYYCAVNKKHFMSLENFTSYIFGDKKPNQVTLILVGWLGIRQSRVDVGSKSMFSSAFNPSLALPVSDRIIQAYQDYKSRYIGDHKYVGIVFRTHHVLYFSPLVGSFANQSKYLLQCSKKLGHVLDKVREKWKIFLAYDIGKFGSKVYATGQAKKLAPLRDQIFSDVFNGSLQVEERDEMLKQAAGGITDRGFVAQLEKMISTNADCIILLGPHSGFIRSSAALYISQHKTKRCIISICAESVYDSSRHLVSTSSIPDDFV